MNGAQPVMGCGWDCWMIPGLRVETGGPADLVFEFERDAALPGDEVVLAKLFGLGESITAGNINT